VTSRGTLVLLYHRVVDLQRDPHRIAVRPDAFAEHCRILRRKCEVVRLGDANPSRRQVAITFDDGYVDNAGDARRILAEAGLPATFFVTVSPLDQSTEAWWDRLEQIVFDCRLPSGALETEIEGRRLWADARSALARERTYLALHYRLRKLRPVIIEAILGRLAEQLAITPLERHTHRWMTVEELRRLADTPGFDIGAHTLTHPFLAGLDRDEQQAEIAGSRAQLERLLERPVRSFSYPYGGPDAFDAVTAELVRDAGFTTACSATGGLAAPGGDPFQLPRNMVCNWDPDTFERWLDGWFRGQYGSNGACPA